MMKRSVILAMLPALLVVILGCATYDSTVVYHPSFRKARVLFKKNDFEAAIPYYTEAINRHPEGWVAYLSRAVCCCKTGKYDEAVADIETAKKLHPTDASVNNAMPHIYALRGWNKWVTGDAIGALRDVGHAVELAPNLDVPRMCRGRMYLETDRFQEAISDLDIYLKTNTKETHRILALIMQGRAYLKTGNREQSLARADEVLTLAPHLRAHYNGEGTLEVLDPEARRRRVTKRLDAAEDAEKNGKFLEAFKQFVAAYQLQPVLDVPEDGPEGRDYSPADRKQIEHIRKALARLKKKLPAKPELP